MQVVESKDIFIIYGFPVNTDRKIKAKRLNIIIKYREEIISRQICIATNINISVKKFDKLSKYKNLQNEIQK